MPLGSLLNSLILLTRTFDPNKPTTLLVEKGKNDKPLCFPYGSKIKSLPRDNPENHGYTKEYIQSYLNELNTEINVRANRVIIVKDNVVIGEQYLHPYQRDSWDAIFSASKTVVALALGLLYDEGKIDLDKPAYQYLGIKKISNVNNKNITLRHLLTMSTGCTFNELESASSRNWLQDYFNSPNKFKVGTKFEYNSLNTYVISAIVDKVSGEHFADFIKRRIFDVLDINECHFDTSLEGYFKGGWGLYILPEDLAKLGILVKDKGVYNNRRLLSEEWIDLMSHSEYNTKKMGFRLDYGFQMWTDDSINLAIFNGLYDQDVFIYRNSGVVVTLCCGNPDAFHGSKIYDITNKYFASEKMNPKLNFPIGGSRDIRNIEGWNVYYDYIANKEFKTKDKVANSVGIMPLLLQNELGTYAKGFSSIKFVKKEGQYFLNTKEGKKHYEIAFDFDKGVRQIINISGNEFDIVADAKFVLTGKGEPLLVFRIYFLEFASVRCISVRFTRDFNKLSIEYSENPGVEFVLTIIEAQDKAVRDLYNNFMKIANQVTINKRIKDVFAPRFIITHEK